MTATIGIEVDDNHKRFYQVTADLKGYRINQLKSIEDNSKFVLEYLNSRMREGNQTCQSCQHNRQIIEIITVP